MHPLDNALWEALVSHHAAFAMGSDRARRYEPEVSPFCAVRDPSERAGWIELAGLMARGEAARTWTWTMPELGPHLRIRESGPRVQMVHERVEDLAPIDGFEPEPLGPDDAQDMLALTSLAVPGPFERRTVELGGYVGVRDRAGRLVAMAGERVRIPGWTEVSAVCTHPEHRGRGLAARLVSWVVASVRARGETPFLHVRGANAGALRLYGKLGFVERRRGFTLALERAAH